MSNGEGLLRMEGMTPAPYRSRLIHENSRCSWSSSSGLVRTASAPSLRHASRSMGSSEEVSMSIGRALVRTIGISEFQKVMKYAIN
jgi:hypothetical protein